MRRMSIGCLREGMVVASHVYGSDGGKLLAKNTKLTGEFINRLTDKGIPSVYIEDAISGDIDICDVVSEEERVRIKTLMRNLFNKIRSKPLLEVSDLQQIKPVLNEIIDQLIVSRDCIYNLVDITAEENYLYAHCVNVCVLSVMTGIEMGYSRSQLEVLAVGALLHDLGMALVPLSIMKKPGKLNGEETKEMRKHPDHSLKLLRQNPVISSISRMIAYQHHERFNGDGYPQGIKKADVLEMSQIVGLVDVYDAVTADRAYRKALPAKEAYELVSGTGNTFFRFDIVKSFLSQVAAYPQGTLVHLNTGQIGIVTDNTKGHSLTPKVRIIRGPDGRSPALPQEIDLVGKTEIVIEKVLSENEQRELLFN